MVVFCVCLLKKKILLGKEKSFLRFGGIAGILARVFFICTIITLLNFGNSTTANVADLVTKFPDHRTGLAVGNVFYFLVSVSLVALALGPVPRHPQGKPRTRHYTQLVLYILRFRGDFC